MIGVLDIDLVWNDVEGLIKKTLDRFPEYGWTTEDVRKAIEARAMQLWVDNEKPNVALITKIVNQPNARQCWIWLVGGEMPDNWENHLNDIENWAIKMGCDDLLEQGRHGWQRRLKDWEKAYTVMRKSLR